MVFGIFLTQFPYPDKIRSQKDIKKGQCKTLTFNLVAGTGLISLIRRSGLYKENPKPSALFLYFLFRIQVNLMLIKIKTPHKCMVFSL